MTDQEALDALTLQCVGHNIGLMHRLTGQRSFASLLEQARGETNWRRLRAYLGVFESYSLYLHIPQKVQTLAFLYELLMHREGDIRRQAAALLGEIIAGFHAGYAKERPADSRPDAGVPTDLDQWKLYLQRIIYPDHKLMPQHQRWIRYTLKFAVDSLLQRCPGREERFLVPFFAYYRHPQQLEDEVTFQLLDTAAALPPAALTRPRQELLLRFAEGVCDREDVTVRAAAVLLVVVLCGVVEDYYLDQTGRGEDTCGDDFITAATWRAGDLARGVYSQGLFRASADPAQDEAYAIYGLQDGQSILQYGPNVTRTYRSDLLGGLVMVTTFDVTEIFAARNRSLQRFFLLEAAVVVWLVSRRLTHPLTVLTAASARIAAGDYALRTRMHTGDELEILSQGFDQMAGAVQDKVEALELSVQQRDDFVGAFTHELKTPMTGIIGYADLLRSMQPDPEEQREAAGAIFHEAQRLEALSGKLLQLMGLGEHAPQLVPVQLDSVFAEARRAVAPALNGCILTMQSNGLTVQGDADLLCDLVINLVTNAAKASTPGSAIAVCAEQADGSIRLTVQDHGQGIPADKLARVVEPFYMVDKSRSRRQGGSGLGLALCSRIAQAHGGTLAMESELGKGTTVTVTLPAPNQTAAELAQEEPV